MFHPRASVLLGALFIVATTPSCTSGVTRRGDEPAGERLRCQEGVALAPPGRPLLANDVYLAVDKVLAVEPSGRTDSNALLSAKAGLWVRVGARVQLTVAGPEAGSIGWGSAARLTHHVVVADCQGGGSAGWLVWPGGFWVPRPACLHLELSSHGQHRDIGVPVGEPCPT